MTALGEFSSNDVLTAADLNAIGTWTTFTPVWTNLTVGNGTVSAQYCEINDLVLVAASITLGSTSSVSGSIAINHPVGSRGGSFSPYNGVCLLADTGTLNYIGHVFVATTTAVPRAMKTDTTYMNIANTSATVPFTWTSTDILTFQYYYQKA